MFLPIFRPRSSDDKKIAFIMSFQKGTLCRSNYSKIHSPGSPGVRGKVFVIKWAGHEKDKWYEIAGKKISPRGRGEA